MPYATVPNWLFMVRYIDTEFDPVEHSCMSCFERNKCTWSDAISKIFRSKCYVFWLSRFSKSDDFRKLLGADNVIKKTLIEKTV